MIEKFETYLKQGNMAENTISAYRYAVNDFYSHHKDLNKKNLLVYKTYLIETFKLHFSQKQTTKRKQPRMVFRSSFPCCNRCKSQRISSDKNRTYRHRLL